MTPKELKAICIYVVLAFMACDIFFLGALTGRKLLILDLIPHYGDESKEKHGDNLLIIGTVFLVGNIVLLIAIKFI